MTRVLYTCKYYNNINIRHDSFVCINHLILLVERRKTAIFLVMRHVLTYILSSLEYLGDKDNTN